MIYDYVLMLKVRPTRNKLGGQRANHLVCAQNSREAMLYGLEAELSLSNFLTSF